MSFAIGNGKSIIELNKERKHMMNSTNPKYVLRNYIAQNAIAKAEEGDFTEVDALFKRLHDPYLSAQL